MTFCKYLFLLALACATSFAQDFSSVDVTKPVTIRRSFPGRCSLGQMLLRSDQTAGQNLYVCGSSNDWNQSSGAAGATTPSTSLPLCGNGSANATKACVAGTDYQSPISKSVKDFGAVGNGTTDDTTAINNAIAGVGGGTVLFPDGVYLHQGITISNAVTLQLTANAQLKLKAASTSNQVRIAASAVTITGGSLDGNSSNNPSGQANIFINEGLDSIKIDGVSFFNAKQSNIQSLGASGTNTSHVLIRNCTFSGAGNHAVYFNWDTIDSEISNNLFLSGSLNAIWAGNASTGIKVLNNRISGYLRMGIEIWGGSNKATVTGNVIENVGTASNAFGISIDSSTGSVIANNHVNLTSPGAGNVGIEIVLSDDSTVTGNVVTKASVGMTLDQSNNVTLSGNRVIAFTGVAGIQVGSSVANQTANKNAITGNRITISQTTGSAIGIWLQANASGVTVNGNALVGNIIDGQNTTSGTAIMLEQDTGTLSRNQVAANAISNVQAGVNHLNDANTSQVLNQYDNVGTKDAGSTTNGRAARFDAYTFAIDDANNKTIQPGTGSNLLVSGLQVGSTSGPRFGNSGGDGLVIPGSDSNTAYQITKADGTTGVFRVTTLGRAAVLAPGTFAGNNTCNSGNAGSLTSISDSTTNTYGATITGGGTFNVLGYCNGIAWTVH